jgi:serum/glucocorticoid-regulated kinase 2
MMYMPQMQILESCVQLIHHKGPRLRLTEQSESNTFERWKQVKQWFLFEYALHAWKFMYTSTSNKKTSKVPQILPTCPEQLNEPEENNENNDVKQFHIKEENDLTASSIREEYEQLRVLGTGAFGSVVLCRAVSTNNLVAIKSIEKAKISQEELSRLMTEREILSKTVHPFIIHMDNAFETTTHFHFVLEYCPGGDLYSLLESQSRLTEHLVVFYTSSIVSALVCLHHKEVAYRDLKPENILLDARGFVRLADFGLAKQAMTPTAMTYTFCGSVDYMAPEVILGHGYGIAADVWSLGCVVFEMFTGLPPFYTTRGRRALFEKICKGHVLYPAYLSRPAVLFLQCCLEVDPLNRWKMSQLLEHPFLASIDWYQLGIQQVPVPYVPNLSDEMDTHHFSDQFTSQPVDGILVDTMNSFSDFDWHREDDHVEA